MPSRQDQLHSYQYSLQRVVAALVTHDPDPSRSPLRRAGTTALVSLLIASLAVGGAAIYGLLTGHSTVKPDDPDVVFQEKGTGARYVFLTSDKKLHPVLNYTSGMLLAAAQTPELKGISAEKLATVPLGAPLGIPDAPDSLPQAGALLTGRWSICTSATGSADSPRSTLLVGDKLTDGTVAARDGKALLVSEPNGRTSMIFDNRRFGIPAARVDETLRALGWGSQQPWPVSAAWANAIPAGPDLVGPEIPGAGSRSDIADLRVGQLITEAGQQFAVILPDGQAALTPMQARLMQAAGADAPQRIGNQFFAIRSSKTRLSDSGKADGLPGTVPPLYDAAPGRACMTLPIDPKSGDGVRIDPTMPTGAPIAIGSVAPGAVAPGSVLADFVHVARGAGVVAVSAASPTAPASTGTVSIVTDTGRSYPLADRTLLTKLGYGDVKPRQIPAELISLLPRGPSLDPARARQAGAQ